MIISGGIKCSSGAHFPKIENSTTFKLFSRTSVLSLKHYLRDTQISGVSLFFSVLTDLTPLMFNWHSNVWEDNTQCASCWSAIKNANCRAGHTILSVCGDGRGSTATITVTCGASPAHPRSRGFLKTIYGLIMAQHIFNLLQHCFRSLRFEDMALLKSGRAEVCTLGHRSTSSLFFFTCSVVDLLISCHITQSRQSWL